MNRVGERLGNYSLVRLLGYGGSAEVYLAEHIFLKTLAAIKVLSVRLTSKDLQNFLNEARIIASLDHPNIVRILEFGVEGSESLPDSSTFDAAGRTPYLVMDYAPNGTLRTRFPRGVRVPPDIIVTCVRQAANALQYAHDRRLIHRDIKPENMLLGRNNEVRVSDFGIALVTQNSVLEHTQEVLGTMGYMAPEQLQGKPRPASDQYALGVIVYEWLCGERPFSGSFIDLFSQHLSAPPPPLRSKVPEIPPAVEAVVMQTLAKDWQERFTSVTLFADALEQACRPYLSSSSTSIPGIETGVTLLPSALPTSVPGSIPGTNPGTTSYSVTAPITPPLFQPVNTASSTAITPPSSSPPPLTSIPSNSVVHQVTPTPPTPVTTAAPQREIAPARKRKMSRRAALLSIGLIGIGAAGGITAWQILAREQQQRPQMPAPTRSPSIPLGKTLLTYTGHTMDVYGVQWSPDGSQIASVGHDATVAICDARTGRTLFTYRRHTGSTNGLAWQPQTGKRIASASSDKTVQVCDALTGGHVLTYSGHTNFVRSVTWSPNGKYIASAGDDKVVRVWDAVSGHTLYTYSGHRDLIWYLRWSPDGTRIASASQDATVHIIDANSGSHLLTYRGHTKSVQALAWSPDSSRIVSASSDTTARVWNAASGKTDLIYSAHANPVQGIDWAPNGKYIASCASNAHVWHATSGNRIVTYNGQPPLIHGLSWSPDSTRIASVGVDTTMKVWQAS